MLLSAHRLRFRKQKFLRNIQKTICGTFHPILHSSTDNFKLFWIHNKTKSFLRMPLADPHKISGTYFHNSLDCSDGQTKVRVIAYASSIVAGGTKTLGTQLLISKCIN